jgi:S-formylglutathione hydrolase FrmB
MKKILLIILTVLLFSGCLKRIKFGEIPEEINNDLIIKQGTKTFLNKKDKEIEMRYIITKSGISREISGDLIFYLHGLTGTEFDWVEKGSFGESFYQSVNLNPGFPDYYAVSVSFGRAFLVLDGLPRPYNLDLETLFINEIIPYFKNHLNCSGNVYLVGHSMGGFNCLSLSMRNPDVFKVTAVLSPYVGPISPFTDEFVENARSLGASDLNIFLMKDVLTDIFVSEERWYEYNPLKLTEEAGSHPYIVFSTAENDLPGFTESIVDFKEKLEENNIEYYFCETNGDHFSVCGLVFSKFLEVINTQ